MTASIQSAVTGIRRSGPVVSLRDLDKIYRSGEVEVHAVRGVTLDIARGGLRGDHGCERLGQVEPDEHARLPGPAHVR
jgi:hypothetical protein